MNKFFSLLASRSALLFQIGLVQAIKSKSLIPNLEVPLVEKETPAVVYKIAYTLHLYYVDEAKELLKKIVDLGGTCDFFIACTSEETFKIATEYNSAYKLNADVRLCKNHGRNFGPLLVEFSEALLNYEFVVHAHTKKSDFVSGNFGSSWGKSLQIPLTTPVVKRSLALMQQNVEIGIVYTDCFDKVRAINFSWGRSLAQLSNLMGVVPINPKEAIQFPAGGMFLARVSCLRSLFEKDWDYSQFPREKGQIDGTIHHGLERYIGHLVSDSGFLHLVYSESLDKFRIWNGWK